MLIVWLLQHAPTVQGDEAMLSFCLQKCKTLSESTWMTIAESCESVSYHLGRATALWPELEKELYPYRAWVLLPLSQLLKIYPCGLLRNTSSLSMWKKRWRGGKVMRASAIAGSLQGTSSSLTTKWKVWLTWKTGLNANLQPEPVLLESTGARKGSRKGEGDT